MRWGPVERGLSEMWERGLSEQLSIGIFAYFRYDQPIIYVYIYIIYFFLLPFLIFFYRDHVHLVTLFHSGGLRRPL